MVTAAIPYAFSSPMIAWRETLGRLLNYEAKTIVPGHGAPQSDSAYIRKIAALFDETLSAVKAAADAGVAYDDLPANVDLANQKAEFAGGDPMAINAWTNYYFNPGLKSSWVSLGLPVPEKTSEEKSDSED